MFFLEPMESAVNANDLTVTLTGNLKDVTIDKADLEVKVNDTVASYNLKKVSNTQYTVELVVPLKEGDKVTVTGLDNLKGSSATTTYKTLVISKVEAVAGTVYSNDEGQSLTFKVDGKETLASDLAKEGYTVTFRATEDVFANDTATTKTSSTGLLSKAKLEKLVEAKKNGFSYNVTVSKNNVTLASEYVSVALFDKTKTGASAISSVTLSSKNIAAIQSSTVIVGEEGLNISKVTADLIDGRKNVELTDATFKGLVKFSSSDVTIATIGENGEIKAVRAGTVDITITSGTAKKVLTLKVVPASQTRQLTTITHSGDVKLVVGKKEQQVGVIAKDQYGDAFKLADVKDIIVEPAVAGGKQVATAKVDDVTDKTGYTTITVTSDAVNTGSGNIKLLSGSKTLATIPVAVASATSADTKVVTLSADSIDLNPAVSSKKAIKLSLKQYYNGYYNADLNLDGYKVVVKDADGAVIYEQLITEGSKTANVTFSRADLILESTGINKPDSDVTQAAAAKLENFETGTGAVEVYAGSALVASKNFSIVDSSATISSAAFADGIEFTSLNATNLKLTELLPTLTTTATAYDGVLRYEVVAGELIAYYDSAAAPNGYKYEDGDVLVGKVIATAINTNNAKFDSLTPFLVNEVLVKSDSVKTGEAVQFNVYKRGDVSVAKTQVVKK